MCPYDSASVSSSTSALRTYTGGKLRATTKSSAVSFAWAGFARPGNNTCPAGDLLSLGVQPTSQTFTIPSLGMAQNNSGSGEYVLSVFRASSVKYAYLKVRITDASGRELLPYYE